MNELRIERNWIQVERPTEKRFIFTLLGILVYLFLTFILDWSWLNYFSISLQVVIQLFFIFSSLKENLIIQSNSIEYHFIFIRKKIEFEYFIIQNSEGEKDERLYSETQFYKRIVFYKNDKPKISFDDETWGVNHFKEVVEFLRNNSVEYEFEKTHKGNLSNRYLLTIIFIISSISFVFGTGLIIENQKNIEINKFKVIRGHIQQQPEILQHSKKGGIYFTMPFILAEYPNHKFILNERGINEINGKEFIETNKVDTEIELMINQNEYDISIAKTRQLNYFTSHIYLKENIRIYGINFQDEHLLNENSYKTHFKENNFEIALFILGCSIISLGIVIYRFQKIASA